MSRIVLHGASYVRLAYPYLDPAMSLQCSCKVLGNLIGSAMKELRARVGGFDQAETVVCSTILSPLIIEVGAYTDAFKTAIQEQVGGNVPAIFSAYQCATWGYALRYYSRLGTPTRLAMSIADVDLHQFRHWTRNQVWSELWGNTGFGITSLLIELDGFAEDQILASSVTGSNTLLDFARATKAQSRQYPTASLSMPFFPDTTRLTLRKFLGEVAILPHFHEEYGHCFGSDPWISLVKHFEGSRRAGEEHVLAASLALNGYFSTAHVTVAHTAPMHFSTCDPLGSLKFTDMDFRHVHSCTLHSDAVQEVKRGAP